MSETLQVQSGTVLLKKLNTSCEEETRIINRKTG